MSSVDTSGLDRVVRRLEAIVKLDYTPVVERWAHRLQDDNADAALAGQDAEGDPLRTTKREQDPAMSRRLGAGKPLAPKGRNSRLVLYARSQGFREGETTWSAVMWWDNFTSAKGESILRHHRDGIPSSGGKIVRDVLGVRPNTLEGARQDVHDFANDALRSGLT